MVVFQQQNELELEARHGDHITKEWSHDFIQIDLDIEACIYKQSRCISDIAFVVA